MSHHELFRLRDWMTHVWVDVRIDLSQQSSQHLRQLGLRGRFLALRDLREVHGIDQATEHGAEAFERDTIAALVELQDTEHRSPRIYVPLRTAVDETLCRQVLIEPLVTEAFPAILVPDRRSSDREVERRKDVAGLVERPT